MKAAKFKAVLFDLDGTLADTAPDLAFALNRTLEDHNRQPLAYRKIRQVVSYGGRALIELGFGLTPEDKDFDKYRQHLLTIYDENLCQKTVLFDGISTLLDLFKEKNIPWGIVTNKPSWLTDPLMKIMELDQAASSIVSGDTCSKNKPHPEPIFHACNAIGITPEETIYVGDALRDIEAGNSAGCYTIACTYGYLKDTDDPYQWNADKVIDHPKDIIPLV